ncbi:MAG: sulfatase [Bacteroidia bacterium]|nr:sulfatase [Bacteroidia bacterium]
MRFTNAYSACTVSSPTRAALMTGKYPAKLHLTDWIQGHRKPYAMLNVPDWTMFLPLEEKTIAESLKEVGYSTWHVGKWHLGDDEKYWAENQGFDVNIAGNYKGSPILGKKKNAAFVNDECMGYFSPYCLPRLENGPDGEYLTDRLTDEAIKLIDNSNGKPFFLNLAHYAVHTPIQGKPEKTEKYKQLIDKANTQKNAEYAAMIESVDESIDRVMKKLEEKKLLENTLVIFASDNGALANISSSFPLKKGKGWAYEGGIRTPLLMYWKGKMEGGRVLDEPVITMDIYSTILDVVGIKQAKEVDGQSLLPVIMDAKKYDRPLFWHYPHYHNDKPHGSVRYGDFKLIEYFEDHRYELYNLKTDGGETTNLVSSNPTKRAELQKMMTNWRKKVGAQLPTPNPNYEPAKANQGGAYTGKE